jgi:hypothetical protein
MWFTGGNDNAKGRDMTLKNRLGGHTNSYHTYSLEEALEGIAAAGYRYVELSAVRGWTEHVPLDADAKTLGNIQRMLNTLGLVPVSLSGHSDLTTKAGLEDGLLALDLCERMGIGIMNTAIGGHASQSEDEAAFMGNIHALADAAAARDVLLGIEIHGEITKSGAASIPVLARIGRPNVLINYDTAMSTSTAASRRWTTCRRRCRSWSTSTSRTSAAKARCGTSPASARATSTSAASSASSTRAAMPARSPSRSSSRASPGRRWPRSTAP